MRSISVRTGVALTAAVAIVLPSAAASSSEPDAKRALTFPAQSVPTSAGKRLKAPTPIARTGANSTSYTDATGEAAGIPDITTVQMSNDDSGFISLRVNAPNRPTLTGEQIFDVFMDTDRNQNTGSSGFDYVIEYYRGAFNLYRWNGSEFRSGVPRATLTFAWSSGATVRINAAELENTRSIGFVILVGDAPNNANVTDRAPDSAQYIFDLRISPTTPPPPPPPSQSNRVRISSFSLAPVPPQAGEGLRASITVQRVGRSGAWNGTLHCRATINKKVIRFFGSPTRGSGSCLWFLPANAAGKTIVGSIGASEGNGTPVFRRFSRRIVEIGARLTTEGGIATAPKSGPAAGERFIWATGIVVEKGGFDGRIPSGKVQCSARIGSQLTLRGKGLVRKRSGIQCEFNIPSGTSGQRFLGRAVVTSLGGKLTINFPYTID